MPNRSRELSHKPYRRSDRILSQTGSIASGSVNSAPGSQEPIVNRDPEDLDDICERISSANRALQVLGFKDIFDCFLLQAKHQLWEDRKCGIPVLEKGWMLEILRVVRNQRGFGVHFIRADRELCAAFTDICARIVRAEIEELALSPKSRKPVSTFTHEYLSNLSFATIGKEQQDTAPSSVAILESMLAPHRRESQSDQPLLGTQLDAPLFPESDSEPVSESEREEEFAEDEKLGGSSNQGRDRKLMRIMAMGLLLYGHSQRANVLQGFIGYYLSAANAGKRVIETLHRLGISISYESVNQALSANARAVRSMLRTRARVDPFFVSFDNMVFYQSVKSHLMRNRQHQKHYTAGYVAFLSGTTRIGLLPRDEMLDWSKASQVTLADIMISQETMEYTRKAAAANIWNILDKHSRSAMRGRLIQRDKEGGIKRAGYERLVAPEIAPIPLHKSDLHTLIAFNKNEALINEVIEIVSSIIEELDLSPVELLDKVILFKGDYMTVRNILYVHLISM